jgi:uncharacterized alkaline shock family protein YloU/adenylate kinase family enzyme
MNIISSFYYHLVWLLKGIKVFALVGRSGTGKSFRAMLLARKYNISFIVDDGLLIKDQKILAGKSSKREKAYLSAIKTALFNDEKHAAEVKKILKKQDFKRILIIGTSIGMVKKISRNLDLPAPSRIINIQDIATEEEIQSAINARKLEGKHIIPVPAIEVKRNYPSMIYETIKIFLKKSIFKPKKSNIFEKTVVRPEFSKRGRMHISETALSQMVLHCVNEFDPDLHIEKVMLKHNQEGYTMGVFLEVPFGISLSSSIPQLQNYILDNIENYTGMILKEVNITVSHIGPKQDFFSKKKN